MGKVVWSRFKARELIEGVVRDCGLLFSEIKYHAGDEQQNSHHWIFATPTNGIRLSQHKNTWQRKRSTGYLICIEYIWKGRVVYKRVEPWVNYPSDMLIAQLTMLPREVK